MKKRYALLLFLCAAVAFSGFCRAEVAWEILDSWKTPEPPIDIAHSADGKKTFILTEPGNILIYSTDDGALLGRFAAEPAVKGLDVSPDGDFLFLINGARQTVQKIAVAYVTQIDTVGSPFLGPAEAPVEIVVFSDFQ